MAVRLNVDARSCAKKGNKEGKRKLHGITAINKAVITASFFPDDLSTIYASFSPYTGCGKLVGGEKRKQGREEAPISGSYFFLKHGLHTCPASKVPFPTDSPSRPEENASFFFLFPSITRNTMIP